MTRTGILSVIMDFFANEPQKAKMNNVFKGIEGLMPTIWQIGAG